MDSIAAVRAFYDENFEHEWERMDRHPIEWHVNLHFIKQYVQRGDKVLDIGGGPGRYSIELSSMGCDMTLVDLSQGNVDFAANAAREKGVSLTAVRANACDLSMFEDDSFDHVLLMGPLYHLLEDADREQAIREAVRCLKPGGKLFAHFISQYAGLLYAMARDPASILYPEEQEYFNLIRKDKPFSGHAFTQAYFIRHDDIPELMGRFPLEPLHFFGSEAMLAVCEENIKLQPQEVIDAWCELAVRFCEDEHMRRLSEHLMYIGRKEMI